MSNSLVLPTLAELRQQIDAIDDQLHDLLRQRADIVHIVRTVKGQQPIFIRPGREASMVRDLVARPAGHIPAGLVMRLWRDMIAAFTLHEQQGTLAIAVLCGAGRYGNQDDLWDIARDYYGNTTPLLECKTSRQAVMHLKQGTAQVAVLPLPQQHEKRPWWRDLITVPTLQIFAQLPFDEADKSRSNWRGNQVGGWAVAALAPEPTGDDHGLLLVWSKTNTRAAEIEAIIRRVMRPITIYQDAAGTAWLVVTAGLLDSASDPLISLAEQLAVLKAKTRLVGGYAVPMHATPSDC